MVELDRGIFADIIVHLEKGEGEKIMMIYSGRDSGTCGHECHSKMSPLGEKPSSESLCTMESCAGAYSVTHKIGRPSLAAA